MKTSMMFIGAQEYNCRWRVLYSNKMNLLFKMFDELEIRIDEVYEASKNMFGTIRVITKSQEENITLSIPIRSNIVDNFLYGYQKLFLNVAILIDYDNQSLILNKLLNKIQSNPAYYKLDSTDFNKKYNEIMKKMDIIKDDETYISILTQRNKFIAHADLNF